MASVLSLCNGGKQQPHLATQVIEVDFMLVDVKSLQLVEVGIL